MSIHLQYDRLFVYSEKNTKYFFTEFGNGINIVHGCNTSGKSTFFLSILYTFGINDGNLYLKELLDENLVFRLDCSLKKDNLTEKIIFIRDDDTFYINREGKPLQTFNGINSDNSAEHIKLKSYLSEIFNFSLHLESLGEYKDAPIETMFLPYYISQTVGWVYLRKSFSGLEFYKNFKEDYLDYYLGITSSEERLEKHKLEKQLKTIQYEISLISKFERKDDGLQITKLVDEKFEQASNKYIESYTKKFDLLTKKENEYVLKCNELGYLQQRKVVLQRVFSNQQVQNPDEGNCPTCSQSLPFGIAKSYEFLQQENDTVKELEDIKLKIKLTQSKINSLQKSISEEKALISEDYTTLNKYIESDVTYTSWLDNKANTKLINNLNVRIGELTVDKDSVLENLKKYKTDTEIEKARNDFNIEFKQVFLKYLNELKVKKLEEQRFTSLYEISAFPSQGVELHKTTMAYHFAFNKLTDGISNIHRFPFMLDAVFKEDIDDNNKDIILTFIAKNKPKDTQTILSIAQAKGQQNNAETYNRDYFNNEANQIKIEDQNIERAFLRNYTDQHDELIKETLSIIYGDTN